MVTDPSEVPDFNLPCKIWTTLNHLRSDQGRCDYQLHKWNLDEELSGVIEVVGKVTPKATIKAVYYAPFREDKSSFDLSLYNEALNILHEFPQYYPFRVTGSS
ncbi:replication protein A 14 kDa subunit [Heterodontus francisci]|uniref:replication protein A 14 kDa subunit n=1 Tax=Heterodontus francisci TaxID=7792 RepID=UPI00355C0EE7